MAKKQKLIILLITVFLSILFFTAISSAAAVQEKQFDSKNPVVTEQATKSTNSTKITIENYGQEGGTEFYFCSRASGTKQTYKGITRNFKYDLTVSGPCTKSGEYLIKPYSWHYDNNKFTEYDISGRTSPSSTFDIKTSPDECIVHDNRGNFYLINTFYYSYSSDICYYKHELIPVAQDITFEIGDVSFNNLDEINSRGNFVLNPSNTYDAVFANVRSSIKDDFKTMSGATPIGVVPFDIVQSKSYLFHLSQSSAGAYIYNVKTGTPAKEFVNGKVRYILPVSVKYDEAKLSIYQDGDVSREYTYSLSLPSKASGTLKISYTKTGSNTVVSTKNVTVSNGKFQVPVQVGQIANFYVSEAESKTGEIAVQAPDVSGTDVCWGNFRTVVAKYGMTNDLYMQYKNDYHNLLLAHMAEGNLTTNVLTTYLQSSEYGDDSMLFFYNVERDGTIAISGVNTNINPVEKITGNIELSDKTINFSSNNFNITKGIGTFTVNSNSKITLKSLPRTVTYKITNVKAEKSTVSAVNNGSGGVGSTVEIKLQAPAVQTYTITWKDWDGKVLKTQSDSKGTTPSYGGTPTRPEDSSYTYTFTGWNPSIVAANANTTYTAQYKATAKPVETTYYTITWLNWDNSVLKTQTVAKGTVPSYSGTPTRQADSNNSYIFTGWNPAVTTATKNAVYTAQYQAVAKPAAQTYTITWKNWDGKVLKTQKVSSGAKPSYNGIPTRAADSKYTYSFKGWTPSVVIATKDASYTATYTSKAKAVPLNVKVKIKTPKAAKAAFTAKWTKLSASNQKKVASIQIQYSQSKNFTNSKITTASKKASSKKLNKLKRKTTYYVRVRTVKGSSFGPWSSVKKIKTK